MSSLALVLLLTGGMIITGITFDMTINAAQDWYGTVYDDARWSYRVNDSPALRDLAREEAEIRRLLEADDGAPETLAK